MPEAPLTEVSTALTRAAVPVSTGVVAVEQWESTWRMARALVASQSFKDVRTPEQAVARIMLGADLGMSPTQALMGIDIVKGNPQIRGVALGRMVRQSARKPTPSGESYDYSILDRDFTPGEEFAVVALYRRDEDGTWPTVPNGESVTFTTSVGEIDIESRPGRKPERLPQAVEAFKLDQAKRRGLIKQDGAWGTQPEVMVVWRALSQLVRFEAPDVIGGMSVYTEADSHPREEIVGGAGEMPEWADDFDPKQRAKIQELMIIARQVGHAGYSNEGTIRMRLNGQTWSVVEQWIGEACTVLDEMAETAKQAEKGEPADDGPLTLTFGGETFTFNDTDDPYSMIASALGTVPDDMRQVAGDLEAIGLSLPAEMAEDRAWYQSMSDALKREAMESSAGKE